MVAFKGGRKRERSDDRGRSAARRLEGVGGMIDRRVVKEDFPGARTW